jgi:hypothetical protein
MAQLSSPLLLSQTESTIACSPYPTQELLLTTNLTSLNHLLAMAPPFFRQFIRTRKPAPPSTPPPKRASFSSSITCVNPPNHHYNQQTLNQQTLTNAIWDANEALRVFLLDHWPHHAAYIKVDCDIPLGELHALSRLPKTEGLRACGRLVRVPVIHEEVALSLWEFLVMRGEDGDEGGGVVAGEEKEMGEGEGGGLGKEKEGKEKVKEKGGQVRVVVGEVEVEVEVERGGDVKRGMGKVVREFLLKRCRLWGRGEKESGKAVKAKVGCLFCSGNCHAYHQPADTTGSPQKGQQRKGEDDFWQREAEGRGPPGIRSEWRQWSLVASFKRVV